MYASPVAKSTFPARIKPSRDSHEVVVVAFDGMIPFDFATPLEVFERVRLPDGRCPYRVRACGVSSRVRTPLFELRMPLGLAALAHAQTIFVPGMADIDVKPPAPLLRAIRAAVQRGARVASICTGAFILASSGILSGKPASTHWLAAEELRRRFPDVLVDVNSLYTDGGNVLTSAGAAAGIDLCLHIVRRDFGAAAASEAAKASVVPFQRTGGQLQYVQKPTPAANLAPLAELLAWVEQNLQADLSLPQLAKRARTSPRTLSRRFAETLGETPLAWVTRARVRRAQELLETTPLSVEQVATEAGFQTASNFRERFQTIVGTSPVAYRSSFSQLAKV